MMDKKEVLIQIITKLKPYRDLADGVLALLNSSYIDQQAIDGLIHLISQSIKSVKKDCSKELLQKGLEKIQSIKNWEVKDQMSDEDLENFLSDI